MDKTTLIFEKLQGKKAIFPHKRSIKHPRMSMTSCIRSLRENGQLFVDSDDIKVLAGQQRIYNNLMADICSRFLIILEENQEKIDELNKRIKELENGLEVKER